MSATHLKHVVWKMCTKNKFVPVRLWMPLVFGTFCYFEITEPEWWRRGTSQCRAASHKHKHCTNTLNLTKSNISLVAYFDMWPQNGSHIRPTANTAQTAYNKMCKADNWNALGLWLVLGVRLVTELGCKTRQLFLLLVKQRCSILTHFWPNDVQHLSA